MVPSMDAIIPYTKMAKIAARISTRKSPSGETDYPFAMTENWGWSSLESLSGIWFASQPMLLMVDSGA